MNTVQKNHPWKCVLAAALLLITCSPESDQKIVARAGERTIGWTELNQSFNLEPKWGRGLTHKEAYSNQLDYLIDEKLFAQAAASGQLRKNDPDLEGYLDFLEEKELIRELYRQEVGNKITISAEEYRQAYAYSKIQLRYGYIETPDSARAQNYLQQLSVKNLDAVILLSPADDRRGESPWIKYGDVAEELERVLFNLDLGQTAGPVYLDGKYYVVKLLAGNREKFQSEMDFAQNKSKIHKIIFDRKAAVYSETYVRKIMSGKDVRLNPDVFAVALNHFTRIAARSLQEDDSPEPVQLNDHELQRMEQNLENLLTEPIVFFEQEQMTVAEFLTKLLNMPAGLRPRIHMAHDLKVAIGRTVRNHYFVKEARSRGLDKRTAIREQIQREQDKAWALVWLKQLRSRIGVTDIEVRQFMESEGYANLRKRLGREPGVEYARDIVSDLKFTGLKKQVADSLRNRYGYEIHNDKLIAEIRNPDEIIKKDPIAFIYREEFY
jgi:hypothetical protein